VQRKGGVLADVDCNTLDSFGRHLCRCRCHISSEERSAITHLLE
jgi:hypothetical protein